MYKSFLCLMLLCHVLSLHSQSTNGNHNSVDNSKQIRITNSHIPNEILSSKFKITETYEGIQGSPYIENFSGIRNNIPLGKFFDIEMKPIGVAFTLYNAYTDEMEISAIEDSENFYRLKKESNSLYVKLKGKLYRAYVFDYQINYFIIISETDKEKCTLLRKEKIVFIKSNNQNVSLVKNEDSSFTKLKDSYFIKLENIVYKIPYKKRNFITLFKKKSDLIATYIKENRLKLSSEEDLLSIVDYYNSLN